MKYCISVLLILVICILSVLVIAASNNDIITDTTEKIIVENNDTLWDIACKINDGSYNNHKIVFAIKKINNLDDVILRPGQTLEVPVIE